MFGNLWCGSCTRTFGRFEGWAAELGDAVQVRAVLAMAGPPTDASLSPEVEGVLADALYDPDSALPQLLELHGTLSAVLLGTDDLLAGGPVAGESAVAELVDDVVAQLRGR